MTPAASAIAPSLGEARNRRGDCVFDGELATGGNRRPALGGLLYGVTQLRLWNGIDDGGDRHPDGGTRYPPQGTAAYPEQRFLDTLLGGFHYMLKEKVVLGATARSFRRAPRQHRDAAADLRSGHPGGGAVELGVLRAAIGVGALAMALYLGLYPIRRRAGHVMFATVAIFGTATIAFGLSTSLILSRRGTCRRAGASDMISVYIREVLIMLWTPDHPAAGSRRSTAY